MTRFWETLAERTKDYTAAEFEAVAYRLASEQVLYYTDRHSRTAYWMVHQYEREFRDALAPLGINVDVNRSLRYVYAIPRHAKASTASIGQTVLALVLRAIYDEYVRAGQVNDEGEVTVELDELQERYNALSGRALTGSKGKLDQLLDTMKRWGIARRADELASFGDQSDDEASMQRYSIFIRPGIVEVLGETAMARLAQFNSAPPSDLGDDDNDSIDEETDNDLP